MTPATWIVVGALALMATVVRAQEVAPDESDGPRLLSEMSAEELAEYPWLDLHLAESILALQASGGLREWQDLEAIPGISAETLELLRSVVRLEAPSHPSWRVRARGRMDDGGAWRSEVSLGFGDLICAVVADARAARGWGSWSFPAAGVRAWLGSLALRGGMGLGEPRPSASRSAPTTVPRRPSLRPHSSLSREPALVGMGLEIERGAWQVHGVHSIDGEHTALALEWHLSAAAVLGTRLDGSREHWRATSMWWQASLPDGTRWHVERSDSRATAVVVRRPLGGWEAEVSTSAADAVEAGIDPISGRRLDRPHRAWQLSARRRWQSGSGTALLRRIRRGVGVGVAETRLQLDWTGGRRPGRWLVRLRHDSQVGPSTGSVRARWEGERGGWTHRLAVSLSQSPGGLGRLFELGAFAGETLRWGALVAFSDAERSILHVGSVPGSGARPRWLPAGEASWSAGLRWGAAGLGLGAWLSSPLRPVALEGGISCRIALG